MFGYDYIYLGPTPCGEECEQVGEHCDYAKMKRECRVYINQLYRILSSLGHKREDLPETFDLVLKSERHDFGTYYEVCARVKESDEKAYDIAIKLENNMPNLWDEQAKNELRNNGEN